MATREFRLPDPGEGLVEAEIVTWRVQVGDEIAVNDIVVEVETSKSLVELPSPYGGTVAELLVAEGDLVEVGAPIIRIEDHAETEAPRTPVEDLVPEVPAPDDASPAGGATGRVPVLVGYGPRTSDAKRRPRKARPPDRAGEEAHASVAASFGTAAPVSRRADHREPLPSHQSEPQGRPLPSPAARVSGEVGPHLGAVLAKPPVRKLARDLGVDLAALAGSGPAGVITREDVEAAGQRQPLPVEAPQPGGTRPPARPVVDGDVRIPVRGVRKATAEAMVASAFTAPHVTEWLTCDVTAAMELLQRLRDRREFRDVKISPLLLVAKAVCLALRRTPELNSRWDEAAQEIVLRGGVNLGIATDTPRGLMVPNVKGADRLSLLELAEALNALVATAREARTPPAERAQGSFTITNVGVFGVDAGTPILNPGEAGILCLGAITRRPWVVGTGDSERIEPRWVTTVALSFDHRLADGAQGSAFLADVAGLLSDPGSALLF
ncbi:MAG: dihydrolipoamide acetyltransferase family protein [Actinomycetes bacterium]